MHKNIKCDSDPAAKSLYPVTAVQKPVQCPLKASDMKIRRRRQWGKTSSPYQDRVQLDISESRRRGHCTTGLRWLVWGCCTIWSFLGSPVRRCYCTEPIPPSWSSPRWLLEENRWRTFRVKAFKNEEKILQELQRRTGQKVQKSGAGIIPTNFQT